MLTACEKTEKVEDFPKHDSKLVANCFFNADSSFIFHLSKSLSPLDNAPFKTMNSPSAYIRVYENNQLFDSFRVSNGSFRGDSTKLPRPNNKYRFECYYPGFGVVKGEDYLPDTLKILGIRGSRKIFYTDKQNDSMSLVSHGCQLDIDLESTSAYGNYLLVRVDYIYRFYIPITGQTLIYDYPVEPRETNRLYDNDALGISLYLPDNRQPLKRLNLAWELKQSYKYAAVSNEYRITIHSYSKSSYEYLRRYMVQYNNLNDPFAQPIPMPNNIINGFGIFGGLATQEIFVTF